MALGFPSVGTTLFVLFFLYISVRGKKIAHCMWHFAYLHVANGTPNVAFSIYFTLLILLCHQ